MTVYGHSGSRKGHTNPQRMSFIEYVNTTLRIGDTWHHGDCIGWDAFGDEIIKGLKIPIQIVYHPPTKQLLRAFCVSRKDFDEVLPPLPYIERNHTIVDTVSHMVFTPSGMSESVRSGTWATVRYAREQEVPHVIIFPDGSIERFR